MAPSCYLKLSVSSSSHNSEQWEASEAFHSCSCTIVGQGTFISGDRIRSGNIHIFHVKLITSKQKKTTCVTEVCLKVRFKTGASLSQIEPTRIIE